MFFSKRPLMLPTPAEALPGRGEPIATTPTHFLTRRPLKGPFPEGMEMAMFGMGCFWGAEKLFWALPGVHVTAVGYSAGLTPNPTYREVCGGLTGHAEVVLVVYDARRIGYAQLLKLFWENHDPTQGMRQGADVGTQYRSGIYTFTPAQTAAAEKSRLAYAERLHAAGHDPITTEILDAGPFYYAEAEHQQYLAKNPYGYCSIGGLGVSCPVGLGASSG